MQPLFGAPDVQQWHVAQVRIFRKKTVSNLNVRSIPFVWDEIGGIYDFCICTRCVAGWGALRVSTASTTFCASSWNANPVMLSSRATG